MKSILKGILLIALLLLPFTRANAQSPISITDIRATEEGAIRLHWQSDAKAIYDIQYADTLIDTNSGETTWTTLYTDYPSHGSNTFWLDTGNYFADPEIIHPKYAAARFYRIAFTGTNTAPSDPTVWISSPGNGVATNGDLTVIVNAMTDQAFLSPKLYVDGQEMNDFEDVTNYVAGGSNIMTATYVLNTT